ncbi:MAG: hypothetical protein ACTIJH_06405 [Moraxellaceae bacterium]
MKMKKLRFLGCFVFAGIASVGSMAAVGAGEDKGLDHKTLFEGETILDELTFSECSITTSGTDLCDEEVSEKITLSIERQGRQFGDNSTLLRIWDQKGLYNVYAAVNKTTEEVSLFPRGLRDSIGQPRTPNLTFDNNTAICSASVGTELISEDDTFTDNEAHIDYCAFYSDDEGFGPLTAVDTVSRQPVDDLSD